MPDLLNAPRPQPAAPASGERRAFVRYLYSPGPLVRFLVRPSFHMGQGQLTDISASGIGLVASHELSAGAMLVVQLPRRSRGNSCTQLARVLRVAPLGNGRWLLGCRLTHRLSNEELMELLGDDVVAPAAGSELPAFVRPCPSFPLCGSIG